MTIGMSAYLANGFLNIIRGTSFTAPTAIYVQLHTGDPGSAGTANASANTTRVAITFAAASGGSMSITGTAPVWTMTASETLTNVSFWDASTSGNFLWSATLTSSRAVNSGDTYTLSTDTVNFTAIAA